MTHRKLDLRTSMANMTYDRLGEDGGADGEPANHKQVLNAGTCEELTLHGYKLSPWKAATYYFCTLILVGCPLLFTYWKPEWGIYWKRRRCSLAEADALIIMDADCQINVVFIEAEQVDSDFDSLYAVSSNNNDLSNGTENGSSTHLMQAAKRFMRYFIYQHIKYIWMPQKMSFTCLSGYDNNTPIRSLLNDFRGFSIQEQMQRLQLYGRNVISVEVKSYGYLLITEILNPFYIFQIASIILWSFDNYVLYASCIFFVSCLSIFVSLYETRKQSQSLHDMVEASNTSEVIVLRTTPEKSTVEVEVSTVDLVPGDVVVIPPHGCTMACDAVLISGNAIVNESMLTGESVPVTKTPVSASEENEVYSAELHKRHTLFCGTQVIQTRYYGTAQVLAVVVRTGFNTAKGELVRSILYPRPLDFKFYRDSMKFIGFMFLIASIGMTYSIYIYTVHGESILKTVVRTLDIVTIVVPPALPAAMTVGTYYAQSRLKKRGIFCISPPRINVSGKLKLVCFDKTGTLTEDGLEVWGVLEVESGQLSAPVTDVASLRHTSQLVGGMATCHSLTYLHGSLTGDPLDVKMFEATKWEMEEPSQEDTHRFDNLIPTIVRPPSSISPPSGVPSACPPSAVVSSIPHSHLISTSHISSSSMSSLHPHSQEPSPGTHSPGSLVVVSSSSSPSPAISSSCPPSTHMLPSFPGTLAHSYHSPLFLLPAPQPPKTPPPSPSNSGAVSCGQDDNLSVQSENTTAFLHSHCGGGGGEDTNSLGTDVSSTRDAQVVNQTLEEASTGNTNYDQVAPTIVRPCKKETYVDPPDITNVAETPMQVPFEIGIVRQFPFSSNTQRMSVLVRILGRQYMDLYAKGAPEVIQSLCRPESLPENLGSILTQYTIQGFRVIALAHRTLDTKLSWHAAQRIPRDQVEKDLTFVGLLILQNMLKPETAPVIRKLKAANIRSVMVTGDNILTAISVARDCSMVGADDRVLLAKVNSPSPDQAASLTFEPADTPDILVQYADNTDHTSIHVTPDGNNPKYHLAVTGKAWAIICQYFPDLVPRIVARGTIFARMSPDQKAQLVEELQEIDYIVGMCGDGANDCGALKAAHVGISLSEAEASVAAPFTSHTNNIKCVPQVVCEGRCALTTNFSVFKYMALYSIIQFVSVLILYSAYSNLTDPEFLYIDLFIVTTVAVFMGYTGATDKLVPEKPLGNLLGAVNLFSVVSQIGLVILAQVAAYFYLLHQPWFTPNQPTPGEEEDNTESWETAAIFYASSFQYLTLCITFSPGHPFRKPIYTNGWLTASILVLTVTNLIMLLCPWPWLMNFMKIKSDPLDSLMEFRVTLLLIVGMHFVLSYSFEYFLATSRTLKKFFQWVTCKKAPKNKYKHVLRDMDEDPSWPPVGTVLHSTLQT